MNIKDYKTWLYFLHAIIIWFGGIYQIYYIFSNKSAEDITLLWAGCLLVSELVALPLALSSKYWVWKLCHIVGAAIVLNLVIGVILYG